MSGADDAIGYLQSGLCVLPAIRAEKRPALPGWKQYQHRRPTEQQVRSWFAGDVEDFACCLLTGAISGHLELIDFDFEAELFERWRELVTGESPGLYERLVIERSQSGGRHVMYRCESPVPGNRKLAQRRIPLESDEPIEVGDKRYIPRRVNDHFELTLTLIETRGEGGLFLCAPTPGYALEQGALDQLPRLTEAERSILIEAACALNEGAPILPTPCPGIIDGRPGDEFNERGDVRDVLRKHGWQYVRGGENEYWRRPGKRSGWSATLKNRVLYVFSSNATPFEAEQSYAPFAVYALLEHGGDFKHAAMALRETGYGETHDEDVDLSSILAGPWKTDPVPEKEQEQAHSESLLPTKSVRQLLNEYPSLRRPVIHGLLREGETMNVIASPKVGKSWLVVDLALAVATGQSWLRTFPTERGDVLIIDNELHRETSAHRIPKVMSARGIALDSAADHVFVANVRGGLKDIFGMARYFQQLEPGRFKLIILDAFYRFMPRDMDENDNGTMSQVYNHLDEYAGRLGCSFVLVHHSSKGNQSGKGVTDVGAGAGSQSRATDTHLVLRPHAENECVVLDAAVRSWPPITPRGLRWTFPVWTPDDSLDPEDLRVERPRRKSKPADEGAKTAAGEKEPDWDASRFIKAFVSESPVAKSIIIQQAIEERLSERAAKRLLELAEAEGRIYRWRYGANQPLQYATVPPPGTSE